VNLEHLFVFWLVSFSLAVIITPAIKSLSRRKKVLLDVAGESPLKIHKTPTSFLGGLGFSISFFFVLIIAEFIFFSFIKILFPLFIGGILVISIGLWDDLKNVPPKIRFLGEIASGLILGLFGSQLLSFTILDPIYIILTIFYVAGIINAVNMQDGIDGLAGGLVLISLMGFFVLSTRNENELGGMISLCLIGALIGFLIYNFPPASIFMGDNGSYFLGFILAFFAISFTNINDWRMFFGPILLVGFPVFDAGYTIVRRLKKGVSPFSGDRSHLYDQLIKQGLSVQRTVLFCWGVQCVFVSSGIIIYFKA
jgi:UDP-GlcNAc:undecaprenyl-phosphate GlcNAc-1-phosphate transferase